MVSLTSVSAYHFLCFLTIIQVKVISGHQVKKVNKKNRDLEIRYMLCQIFTNNVKDDPKTLFDVSKSVKNKIRKIMVKSQNEVKSACFFTCFMTYLSHF